MDIEGGVVVGEGGVVVVVGGVVVASVLLLCKSALALCFLSSFAVVAFAVNGEWMHRYHGSHTNT